MPTLRVAFITVTLLAALGACERSSPPEVPPTVHPFIVALICLVLSGALITYEVRRLARKDAAERARCPYTVRRSS